MWINEYEDYRTGDVPTTCAHRALVCGVLVAVNTLAYRTTY